MKTTDPHAASRSTAVLFIFAVQNLIRSKAEWSDQMEQYPQNARLKYGTSDFWDAVREVATFAIQTQHALRLFPGEMKHALSNLAVNLARYDQITLTDPIPVPLTMVGDVEVIESCYNSLGSFHEEPFQIESPETLQRAGLSVEDIARAWRCTFQNGDLDIRRVEAELRNPGSVEFFKKHPEQVERDEKRSAWLEFYGPVRDEVYAQMAEEEVNADSIDDLFEQGIDCATAADMLGIDASIVRLAYQALESGNGNQDKQPAKKSTKRATKKKTPTKKKTSAVATEDSDVEDDELFLMPDQDLQDLAETLGIAVAEPFDRDDAIAKIKSQQTATS